MPEPTPEPPAVPPSPMRRRFCIACQQDLAGLTVARCPECGRDFDPADPASTLENPTPAWRRSLILKHGVRVCIVLGIILAFRVTVLPRPAQWHDWRLWLWFGRPIGVMNVRHGDHEIFAHYWFGDELRRDAFRVDNNQLAWSIEDRGGNIYRLRALEPGIPYNSLMSAFNSIKGRERFFGVRIGRADRQESAAPFAVEGDEVAVFSALMREYGYRITPFRLSENQPYVWTWDSLERRMTTVEVTPETRDTYPLDDSDRRRVLIPKPR